MKKTKSTMKGLGCVLGALVITTLFFTVPAQAHNDPYSGEAPTTAGLAGNQWSPSKGRVAVVVADMKTDGHCVVGRAHVGGRWRHLATDCSNNGIRNYVSGSIGGIRSGSVVNTSVCIKGHYGPSTCVYSKVRVR